MKRPKIVRRRYTREAWKRKEDQCMKALSEYLNANKEKFQQSFGSILNGQPFRYEVEVHPKLKSAIDRAKADLTNSL